jgi:hypothetical protein
VWAGHQKAWRGHLEESDPGHSILILRRSLAARTFSPKFKKSATKLEA